MSSPNEINENVTGTQPVTDTSTDNLNDNLDPVLDEQKEPDAPAEQHEDSQAAVDDAETMKELLGESDNEHDVNNPDENEAEENENVEEDEENENEDSSVENEAEAEADDAEQTEKSPSEKKQKKKPAQKKKRKQTAPREMPQISNIKQLVEQALCTLKDRKGSSAQAIASWGKENTKLISITLVPDKLVKQVSDPVNVNVRLSMLWFNLGRQGAEEHDRRRKCGRCYRWWPEVQADS